MLTTDEGLRNTSYKDTVGKTTVGIGFNMDDPHAQGIWIKADIPESYHQVYNRTQTLSTESAWKLLNVCIENSVTDLKTIFENYDGLPELIQLALINLMFNMGKPVFSQFKTFIGLVQKGEFEAASNDLARTKWATQVPNRAMRVCSLLKEDDLYYR